MTIWKGFHSIEYVDCINNNTKSTVTLYQCQNQQYRLVILPSSLDILSASHITNYASVEMKNKLAALARCKMRATF